MMLYLGIDQHARQITVSLRADNGDVLEAWGSYRPAPRKSRSASAMIVDGQT